MIYDPESPPAATITVSLLNLLFSAIGVVLTLIVLVTIISGRKKEFASRRYSLALVQSCVDFGIGLGGLSSGAVVTYYGHWVGGQPLCSFVGFYLHLWSGLTMHSLAVIAFERKQAIVHKRRLSSRQLGALYCYGFCVSAFVACFPFMGAGTYVLQPAAVLCYGHTVLDAFTVTTCAVVLCAPTSVILYSYASVWLELRRTRVAVAKALTVSSKQAARAQKEELRAALTMATCAGVFACCWFSVVVAFFCGLFGAELTLLWDAINLNSGYASAALSPMVYGLFSPQLRRGARRTFLSCCCRGSSRVQPQQRFSLEPIAGVSLDSADEPGPLPPGSPVSPISPGGQGGGGERKQKWPVSPLSPARDLGPRVAASSTTTAASQQQQQQQLPQQHQRSPRTGPAASAAVSATGSAATSHRDPAEPPLRVPESPPWAVAVSVQSTSDRASLAPMPLPAGPAP